MRRRLLAGAASWLALLTTAGCEQILGLHERSESTDGGSSSVAASASGGPTAASALGTGQCGPLLHASVSCAACMDRSCCSEAQACAKDLSCQEASNCLAACTDAACSARCAQFYSIPDSLIALRACRLGACASPCRSSCGEFASAIPGCQSCEEASCCAQEGACSESSSCAHLNLCVSNCFGAASCPNDCESQYAAGVTSYTAALDCSNRCSSPCGSGQTWACLNGPVDWLKPNAVGVVAFSVTFVSFTTEQPFVGAKVKACSKLDFECSSPMDSATADASGRVTVHVPTGLSGFDGYLDVSGGSVGGSGAPAFPTIWYPIPYVIADGWRGRTQILSSDEFLAITMATGTTPDPKRGHVAMNAADCAFTPAAGVHFSVGASDMSTVTYYLVGGVPVTTATETDSSGIAAFVNVPTTSPARLTVVSATSGAANGKSMGSITFIVRAGTLTTSELFPPLP